MTTDPRIGQFIQLYQSLQPGAVDMSALSGVYAETIEFSDPFHRISGLQNLASYFRGLYQNIAAIRFDFHRVTSDDDGHIVHWTMTYRHPQLYRGRRDIAVEGVSLLRWHNGRITHHKDIFDGGALLYEHLPLLGRIIHWLKERMA